MRIARELVVVANRGDALLEAALRGDSERAITLIEQALHAYRAALTVYTKEAAPRPWAGVQNMRGRALTELAIRSDHMEAKQLLRQAVDGYRVALDTSLA